MTMVALVRMRRTRGFMSGFGETVLLDARIELRACEAEELGRTGLVVPRLRERPDDERAFDLLEVDAASRQRRHRGRVGRLLRLNSRSDRQVLGADRTAVGEDHRTLDGVAQLTHVAGPVVGEELIF